MNTSAYVDLTDREIRQIRRYCLLSSLPGAALIGALLPLPLLLLLAMVDEVFLNAGHNPGHEPFMLAVLLSCLAVSALSLLLFLCAIFVPRVGMRRSSWLDLLDRLELTPDSHPGLSEAQYVAREYGVSLPYCRRWQRLVSLGPSLLLSLVFIPEFLFSVHTARVEKRLVNDALLQLESRLQDDRIRIYRDDPYEVGADYCALTCWVEDSPDDRYVRIELDRRGRIAEISWCLNEAEGPDKEKTLGSMKELVTRSFPRLLETGVALWTGELDPVAPLSGELSRPYLQGVDSYEVWETETTYFSLNYMAGKYPVLYYTAHRPYTCD